jgi:hypothetical protein
VVDSLSASAGYALASAATRMVATPSSKVGSIGVVAMHIDFSGALDQAGIEITYIEAPKGGMKTAGTPYRRLDKRAEAYFQDFVDAGYEDFVALIGENRGLEDAAIRETEARVFRAEEALALGLIDEVKTPSEAVSTFLAELADDEPSESEDEDMTTPKTPANGAAAPEATSAPTAEQIQTAVAADRERMAAIKALPEAAEKPKLAETLGDGRLLPSSRRSRSWSPPLPKPPPRCRPSNADDQRTAAIKALPEAAKRPKLAETLAVGGYTAEQAKPILAAALEEDGRRPQGGRHRTISKTRWARPSIPMSAPEPARAAGLAARVRANPSLRLASSRITRPRPAAVTRRPPRSNFAHLELVPAGRLEQGV